MPPRVLGLDVGGANLKAAHSDSAAHTVPFALWRNPAGLADALRALLAQLPAADRLAVTMTGELCDCFESKRQGVSAILDAVAAASPLPLRVWGTDGRFTDPETARAQPLRMASANWLALATFAGRHVLQGPALLLDIGSTTTDIVPLRDGGPTPIGRTDPERMRSGELVYRGVRRTPLCVLSDVAAAELFATTQDVFLALGTTPEDPSDRDTADGRPATRAAAHARLARMLCADLESTSEKERLDLAGYFAFRLTEALARAVRHVAQRYFLDDKPSAAVVSGSGEFLARRVLRPLRGGPPWRVTSLAAKLGPEVSTATA
jgi:probable H4MPT-linked C1 transfer pathway protein